MISKASLSNSRSYVEQNKICIQERSSPAYKQELIACNRDKIEEQIEQARSKRTKLSQEKYFKNKVEEVQYYIRIMKYNYQNRRKPIVQKKNFVNKNQQIVLVFMKVFDRVKDIVLENRLIRFNNEKMLIYKRLVFDQIFKNSLVFRFVNKDSHKIQIYGNDSVLCKTWVSMHLKVNFLQEKLRQKVHIKAREMISVFMVSTVQKTILKDKMLSLTHIGIFFFNLNYFSHTVAEKMGTNSGISVQPQQTGILGIFESILLS